MNMPLEHIEQELRKRWKYPYRWGKKQNNKWDARTNFIYKTKSWEALVEKMKEAVQTYKMDKQNFFNMPSTAGTTFGARWR